MLPTPPMMTTIRAFMVNSTPIEALNVRNMLISTPADATSAPPSAKAKAEARRTSMATSCADTGSTATARIAVPSRVRVSRQIDRNADHDGERRAPAGG